MRSLTLAKMKGKRPYESIFTALRYCPAHAMLTFVSPHLRPSSRSGCQGVHGSSCHSMCCSKHQVIPVRYTLSRFSRFGC